MDTYKLLLFAFLLIVYTLITIRKYGIHNAGVLLSIFYTVIAVLAVHLYSNFQNENFEIHLFNLLYLLFFLILYINTFIIVSSFKGKFSHPPTRKLHLVCIIVIIGSFLGIRDVFEGFSTGFVQLLIDDNYGAALYTEIMERDTMSGGSSKALNYFSILSNVSRQVSSFLLLYYLSVKKKNTLIVLGLILSTFLTYMQLISIGSRAGLVSQGMFFLFMYLFMKKYYDNKTTSFIRPVILLLGSVVVLSILLVTVSRSNADKKQPIEFIESYAAQSIINFGRFGTNPGGCRYGDKTFPLFKSLITDNVANTYYKRIQKYPLMKMNESVFYTFVGDFTLDFGPLFGGLILLLMLLLIKSNLPRGNIIGIHHLCAVYILIMIATGFYQYPLSDNGGNLYLLAYIILYFYFRTSLHTSNGKIEK